MTTTPASGYFSGLSLITLIFGAGFLCVSLILWSFLRQTAIVLFGIAMLFAGFTNSLLCLVLHRMEESGYKVGYWRGLGDFSVYSEYWRVAPTKNWSRFPLIGAIVCGIVAAAFLFSIMLVGSR